MHKDLLFETIAVYDALGATYTDKIAKVRFPQLEKFIGMLPQGARVLDVGYAAGRDSALLRDKGCQVTGIDLAEKFLEIALREVSGVEFLRMDARDLATFPNETFDGVLAHAVLLNQAREETPSILQGFARVLKASGVCLVAVKEGPGEKFIGEALVENMKRRETYFAQHEMEGLLKDSGFAIVRSSVEGDELGRGNTRWLYVFAKKN